MKPLYVVYVSIPIVFVAGFVNMGLAMVLFFVACLVFLMFSQQEGVHKYFLSVGLKETKVDGEKAYTGRIAGIKALIDRPAGSEYSQWDAGYGDVPSGRQGAVEDYRLSINCRERKGFTIISYKPLIGAFSDAVPCKEFDGSSLVLRNHSIPLRTAKNMRIFTLKHDAGSKFKRTPIFTIADGVLVYHRINPYRLPQNFTELVKDLHTISQSLEVV